MPEQEPEHVLRVTRDPLETSSFHPWFAVRPSKLARAAVALTIAPQRATDTAFLEELLSPTPGALFGQVAEGGERISVLDLCAGTATVAREALRLGLNATAVELNPIPYLISRCLLEFPATIAEPVDGSPRWAGLVDEVEQMAARVLDHAKEIMGELWDDGLEAIVATHSVVCGGCGARIPLVRSLSITRRAAMNPVVEDRFVRFEPGEPAERAEGNVSRGSCSCWVCDESQELGSDFGEQSVGIAAVRRTAGTVAVEEIDSVQFEQLQAKAHARYEELHAQRRLLLPPRGETFARLRNGNLTWGRAQTPYQRLVLGALVDGVLAVDEEMRHANHESSRRIAVTTYLGLFVSVLLDYLVTTTGWDARAASSRRALARQGWRAPVGEFAQLGGAGLTSRWSRAVRQATDLIRQGTALGRRPRLVLGDASSTGLPAASFDAVIWDPPYFDNIDYSELSEPFYRVLRAMLVTLVPNVFQSEHVPEGSERYFRNKERDAANAAYLDRLREQALEAVRVCASGARIGVLWVASDPVALQEFTDLVQPAGMELEQAVRLDTEVGRVDAKALRAAARQLYLLVFRVVTHELRVTSALIDAHQVLRLADAGAPSLYAGLAEVLEQELDAEDLASLLPAHYNGTDRERLEEFVAGHADPEQLVIEYIGRVRLRARLVDLATPPDELVGRDASHLARDLLNHLGFTVAQRPRFSVGASLMQCQQQLGRLPLVNSAADLRGRILTIGTEAERVLRFCVATWSFAALGDEWRRPLLEILQRAGSGASRVNLDRLSLGDWWRLFVDLPAELLRDPDVVLRPAFEELVVAFRRGGRGTQLDGLIGARNGVAHENGDLMTRPPQDAVVEVEPGIRRGVEYLQDLRGQRVLPVVLQPVEERRDRFNRHVLQLIDEDARDVEMYTLGSTDLTRPYVWLRSGSNPREVLPTLLDLAVLPLDFA